MSRLIQYSPFRHRPDGFEQQVRCDALQDNSARAELKRPQNVGTFDVLRQPKTPLRRDTG